MEFRVLQWCHPMPAPAEGGQAVVPGSLPCMVRESGFRPAHFWLVTEIIMGKILQNNPMTDDSVVVMFNTNF